MNIEKIIIEELKIIVDNPNLEINENSSLMDGGEILDSMNLVNLCLRLEEISEEFGFIFDWSGDTMSKSKSMFRSVKTLANEFKNQKESK